MTKRQLYIINKIITRYYLSFNFCKHCSRKMSLLLTFLFVKDKISLVIILLKYLGFYQDQISTISFLFFKNSTLIYLTKKNPRKNPYEEPKIEFKICFQVEP